MLRMRVCVCVWLELFSAPVHLHLSYMYFAYTGCRLSHAYKLATTTYESLSVAQPTHPHLLYQLQYQPTPSLPPASHNLRASLADMLSVLLCTICMEQVTAIHPISQQFQLIQISYRNPSVCSSLISTVVLPPSDHPRLRFKSCA